MRGNYGGLAAKTQTGGWTYVLALPSIVTNTGSAGQSIEISANLLSGTLLFNGKNLTGASSFNPNVVVFSGSALPTSDSGSAITNLAGNLKATYSGSDLAGYGPIQSLVSTPSGGLGNIGTTLITGQLGGTATSNGSGNQNGPDTTPPAGGDFTMPGISTSTNITLSITCPTDAAGSVPIQMAYGNSGSPTNWTSCNSSASHTLTAGDGTKTVYVRFRDSLSNTTADISKTTTLNTLPVGSSIGVTLAVAAYRQFQTDNGYSTTAQWYSGTYTTSTTYSAGQVCN
ncbi:hypothetical protein [Pseudoduganella sp. UC29_71]|uniref:hypothetical protein n=1 Tax=Pseudoduganella sp. UC29_71 TaxID=3350174 RepID=UPI00366E7F21